MTMMAPTAAAPSTVMTPSTSLHPATVGSLVPALVTVGMVSWRRRDSIVVVALSRYPRCWKYCRWSLLWERIHWSPVQVRIYHWRTQYFLLWDHLQLLAKLQLFSHQSVLFAQLVHLPALLFLPQALEFFVVRGTHPWIVIDLSEWNLTWWRDERYLSTAYCCWRNVQGRCWFRRDLLVLRV